MRTLFCELMDRLREIQALRTTSGVMLFDPKGKLRYVNEQALELIPSLNKRGQSGSNAGDGLPSELIDLVNRMVSAAPRTDPFTEPVFYSAMMTSSGGIPLSLQGIPLVSKGGGGRKKPVHHLILVERIVERRSINDTQIQGLYKFTDREIEVLRLVCEGATNKEISDRLFISNHTVKDHIRHIMAKLGVKSRNRIVSAIKNH